MKRFIAIFSFIACACLSYAQFAVELKNDDRIRLVEDGTFMSDNGNFSFGGTNISNISKIYLLSKEQEGSVLVCPNDSRCKDVYIYDCHQGNENSDRALYSAEYILQIAGLPYKITKNIDEAIANASMILFSSGQSSKILDDDKWETITSYIEDGGTVILPGIEFDKKAVLSLLGVSAKTSSKTHYRYTWIDEPLPELVYFDTPEEKTVSLARNANNNNTVTTTAYTVTTAKPLAHYEDDATAVAVIKNQIGKGFVYAFGVRWRDVIQRSHLNKDFEAQRGSSNTFDPSADIYPFFVRATHAALNPVSAWKYTVPDGYKAVLIPTHDCDSRTAYDNMHYVADYEQSLGLRGHYFLTTHYFRQENYMSAYYDDNGIENARKLVAAGHTVGSHSICHFPDFSTTDRFPMTVVTEEEYALTATHDVNTKVSSGSTWAEVVLSKNIIERDLGNNVRSFRSGHLCVNKNMPEAHKIGGYKFSSCYTASDVLSEFPFIQRMKNEWEGEPSGILQMPLHFSDVFSGDAAMNENNWAEKPSLWFDIFTKNKNNYASSILLIHPNKEWKMEAQRMLIDMFDRNECGLYNFEDYGDFWLARNAFRFVTFYDETAQSVTIQANASDITANKSVGIFLEAQVPLKKITLIDETGLVHATRIKPAGDGKFIITIK